VAAIAVAVFAFAFSSLFTQTQAIQLYWQVTGAIYGGGAGSVVIGGLYWKRGTAAAAWSAMIVGATCALGGLVLQQIGPDVMVGNQHIFHGQWVALLTSLTAITTYITVSLLTSRQPFNMDKMLHRGEYAIAGEKKKVAPPIWKRFNPAKIIGVDEEFSFWDKVIAYGIFGWVWTTFTISMIGVVWNLFHPWTTDAWVTYWFIFGLCVPFVASVGTTIWFTIGGIREIGVFFHTLKHEKRDDRDDGSVGPSHPA
jgi:SSS family solute:Na+ symporter